MKACSRIVRKWRQMRSRYIRDGFSFLTCGTLLVVQPSKTSGPP